MTLRPLNKKHKRQIIAGIRGRKSGHGLERILSEKIGRINPAVFNIPAKNINGHIFTGDPAQLLLAYIFHNKKIKNVKKVETWWLGGLATSGEGDTLIDQGGKKIGKSKSDIVVKLHFENNDQLNIGVSVKTCSKSTPTNAQLFFTTASAFCELLRKNNIEISGLAEKAMKMFCGDVGFRPLDFFTQKQLQKRQSDPTRWFWEELLEKSRRELESIFAKKQDQITEVLLKKAYADDPFPPEYVIHQTRGGVSFYNCEVAIYSTDQLIALSRKYAGFHTKSYFIRKGTYKGDKNEHLAPRFGIVQMQRGGQKQHPTQLQFNLKAGYFYDLGN